LRFSVGRGKKELKSGKSRGTPSLLTKRGAIAASKEVWKGEKLGGDKKENSSLLPMGAGESQQRSSIRMTPARTGFAEGLFA